MDAEEAIEKREVIIIGSGPAGLTAAIYAARANLKPLVFEGYSAGGQLMITTDVENFPGFRNGITGPDLMAELRAQAERFGTEFITADVTKIENNAGKTIIWEEDKEFEAQAVIIATGASANLLGLASESRLMGKGVSACATCDGFFFQNKEICVVGGGDSALEEATFLTRFASKVYVIHRRDQFRASNIMVEKAEANEKIEFILDTIVEDILGEDSVTGVKLKNKITGELKTLNLDGVFMAVGHTPNTSLFKGLLEMDEQGYIVTSNDKTKLSHTNVAGIFACGDVQDSSYRQAISAAGSGCIAALDAERYIESIE